MRRRRPLRTPSGSPLWWGGRTRRLLRAAVVVVTVVAVTAPVAASAAQDQPATNSAATNSAATNSTATNSAAPNDTTPSVALRDLYDSWLASATQTEVVKAGLEVRRASLVANGAALAAATAEVPIAAATLIAANDAATQAVHAAADAATANRAAVRLVSSLGAEVSSMGVDAFMESSSRPSRSSLVEVASPSSPAARGRRQALHAAMLSTTVGALHEAESAARTARATLRVARTTESSATSSASFARRRVTFVAAEVTRLTAEAATLASSVVGIEAEVATAEAHTDSLAAQVIAAAASSSPGVRDSLSTNQETRPPSATLPGTDLTRVTRDAYVWAAATVAKEGCWVPWTVLAGIGKVESNHGRFRGASVAANGDVTPKIIGIALDGTRNTMAIRDTDGGLLDGDVVWDRAVGPMQFIPSTWARNGADGNGDGVFDPHNLFDTALAAARYLCRATPGSYTDEAGMRRALLSYNRSRPYGTAVLGHAARYAMGGGVIVFPSRPTPAPAPSGSSATDLPLAPGTPPTSAVPSDPQVTQTPTTPQVSSGS